MLALAQILGLVILNALLHGAFMRRKLRRRTSRAKRRAAAPVVLQYPLHPSPGAGTPRCAGVPEQAAHIRPAGIDW